MQGKLHVDVGMWGGLTPQNSGNPAQLQGMLDAGALGLKCFLSPSGAPRRRSAALLIGAVPESLTPMTVLR